MRAVFAILVFCACCCCNALVTPKLPGILCHGELLFDCIGPPGAGLERVMAGEYESYAGGAPGNVAVALRKLKRDVAFAGGVGDDSDGDSLLETLRKAQVDLSLATRIPQGVTRRCMVTRDLRGDRTFAAFRDGLTSSSFADCSHHLPSPTSIDGVKWLVQGTLSLATPISARSTRHLQEQARKSQALSVCDVNWRPVFWDGLASLTQARSIIHEFSRMADIVKLTDEEAEWLLDISADTALSNPSLVRRKFPLSKAILVTGGEKGAAFDVLGHTGRIPCYDVDVRETCGAGDAFLAGFIDRMYDFDFDREKEGKLGEKERRHVTKAVEFASAVGALTCTSEGAIEAQPLLSEVQAFLERHALTT